MSKRTLLQQQAISSLFGRGFPFASASTAAAQQVAAHFHRGGGSVEGGGGRANNSVSSLVPSLFVEEDNEGTREEDDDLEQEGEETEFEISTSVGLTIPNTKPHPDETIEAAALAAAHPPKLTKEMWEALEIYQTNTVSRGKVSILQLDTILRACEQFKKILPSGERGVYYSYIN